MKKYWGKISGCDFDHRLYFISMGYMLSSKRLFSFITALSLFEIGKTWEQFALVGYFYSKLAKIMH